ncbi:cobalamin B12-binding domain-containing protein [Saccharomonospora saliphila]|uniref:cobalamin B12-binding domain-containing protein n=1 Tax=Saccharomonospora saliphila TaxID=369829 RepID=UPI001E2D7E2E|nr:cobalamin-dependent protein [Saccharomonospora saliphila]
MTATHRRILLSSVSSDAHTWNLVWLQMLLTERGNRVDNLGACVPDDLLVSHARSTRPDAIVLSTVNGHGLHDGVRVIGRLRAADELRGVPVVIGGKLGVAGPLSADDEARLREAGFDAVFPNDASPADFLEFVDSVVVTDLTAEHSA